MSFVTEDRRFLGGMATGAAGTAFAWQFGPGILASGWTSLACAAGLAAAAGVVAAGRWIGAGVDPVLRDMNGTPPSVPTVPAWRQADDPADWLRAAGAAKVPGENLRDLLVYRLSSDLHPVPADAGAVDGVGLADEAAALATALALMTLGRAGRVQGRGLLRVLAASHAHRDPSARETLRRDALRDASRMRRSADVAKACGRSLARHATRETFVMGLLQAARGDGPVGTGEFAWLKGADRGLWYALENLGREAFHVEGLAAMDHYRHELAARSRLLVPHVFTAVETLAEIALEMRDGSFAEREIHSAEGERDLGDILAEELDLDFGPDLGKGPSPA